MGGSATAGMSTGNINKNDPQSVAKAVAAMSKRSVYAEALAVSGDVKFAANVAKQAHQPASMTPMSTTASPTASPMISNGSIIGSACVKVYGDANYAYGHTCTVQTLMSQSGSTWYIGDDVTGSANDTHSVGYRLWYFHAWVGYNENGNHLIKWNPSSTATRGSCSNYTASIGYGSSSISSSQTVCPDRLDPTENTASNGVKWTGCDYQNYTEGAPSTDVEYNGPGADISATAKATIAWHLCA